MSLEYQVEQLVAVLSRGVQNNAVAEIIRQRDEAQGQSDRNAHDAKFYMDRRDELYRQLEASRRSNAALRGVITRMKKATKGDRG